MLNMLKGISTDNYSNVPKEAKLKGQMHIAAKMQNHTHEQLLQYDLDKSQAKRGKKRGYDQVITLKASYYSQKLRERFAHIDM